MSDTFVTIDQFNEILARLGRLEHKEQYTGRHEDVYKDVEELKKKFPDVEKDVSVIRTRFDSLEEKMDYRFDMLDEKFTGKFNTQDVKFTEMDKRLDFQSKLLIAILVAILGMFATLIIFLFSITKII